MSAIWGVIDLDGNEIPDKIRTSMKNAFGGCVIDRYDEINCGNVYMGCGIQYFTEEAEYEQLPWHDEKNEIFYTADAVLDNREEIAQMVQMKLTGERIIPDGELMLHAFQKKGVNSLGDMRGAYVFVYFDRVKNEIYIIPDAVGNRSLYYCITGHTLYFSSLLESLRAILPQAGLNERWMTDFLAMDSLIMISENNETPIQGINRVSPGCYFKYDASGAKETVYWNPVTDNSAIKLKNDEEYGKAFTDIFRQAVKDTLRVDKTSIMLSSGYDSSAVASLAAPLLKQQNKNLYAYTSVPDSRYYLKNNSEVLRDESDDVKKTAEYFGNIICRFVDSEGKNPWNERKQMLETMEMPYKTVQNVIWLKDIMEAAYQNGSRMVLSGSFGNTTVSFSNVNLYLYELLKKGKWIRLWREVGIFCKKAGIGKKAGFKDLLKMLESEHKSMKPENVIGKSYVSKYALDTQNAIPRLCSLYQTMADGAYSGEKMHAAICQFLALRQIGEMHTKLSLSTGVLVRDPTKDRRIVEFCLNIPIEQFQKDGEERRLISVYMKDIVPPHIISERRIGVQSSDIKDRLHECWPDILQYCAELFGQDQPDSLIDGVKIRNDIQRFTRTDYADIGQQDIVRLIYTALAKEYMDRKKK